MAHGFRRGAGAFLTLLAFGCSKASPTPAPAPAPVPTPVASASASTAKPDAGPPSAAARTAALADLDAGRKLSRAKEWSQALEAFDRALAVMPDDPRILSEVGWAALQANRLDRAEEANARALANAREPLVRAPILYNAGRVAEARGKPDVAKNAYRESLALRANAEVKRRLDALGNDGGSDDTDGALRCREAFPDIHALCKCFETSSHDQVFVPHGSAFKCGRTKSAKSVGDGRLGVIEVGGDEVGMGERLHLLFVQESGRVRWLENLGSDYEPGAFGVHNAATVLGGERRNVAGHTIVVVRSAQDDNDFNMAGLELCEYHAKLETVCALGDKPGETRCTPPIPTEVKSGCGPGVEVDAKDLDETTREMVREIKKNASSKSLKTSWAIGEDGKVTVTIVSGTPDLLGPGARSPAPLWK